MNARRARVQVPYNTLSEEIMVYYRKYRPQKIEELDESSVRETLKAVLLSKKSNFHAFLFTGPKGLGKTSAARILAKFLNCEKRKPQDLEPCNRCYQCTSITNGSNLDILEIDAASNRGIDEIRDLRERINLSTAKAKYKVYIIDEVHMLTAEAFNALLKTLEEPPSHAVFVLCTTEPQKVPATITSRCLHVSFSLATSDELVRSLKRIVTGEKLNVDKEALEEIALLSDGSFRDGSKILQELSSKAGSKKITKEFVEKEYKVSSLESKITSLVSLLEEKDVKKSLEVVQKLVDEGVDIKYFVEGLSEKLHFLLISKIEDKNETKLSLEELKKLLELLITASSQVKYAVLPQLPLELAIVEFTAVALPHLPEPARQTGTKKEEKSGSLSEGLPKNSSVDKSSIGRPSVADQMGKPPAFLQELILKINSENHSIAGLLRGVSLKDIDGKKVVMETKYKFHKERLEERSTVDLIEKMASEILGKNVTINFVLRVGDSK